MVWRPENIGIGGHTCDVRWGRVLNFHYLRCRALIAAGICCCPGDCRTAQREHGRSVITYSGGRIAQVTDCWSSQTDWRPRRRRAFSCDVRWGGERWRLCVYDREGLGYREEALSRRLKHHSARAGERFWDRHLF
jgi:hypothetical protein